MADPKPARERRIRPDLQPVAATPEAPTSGLSTLKPPFRAVGVKVVDKEGRTVCICASEAPLEVRASRAEAIARAMNDHVAAGEASVPV